MHILVTGSNGFIGSALVRKLKQNKSHHITTYDIGSDKEILQGKYDVVYWLAAVSDTQEKNNQLIWNSNIKLLYDFITSNNSKFISFASSASVYGKTTTASSIDDKVKPDSLYAKSKMAGELLLDISGVNHNIIRLFNVYSTDGVSEYNKRTHSSPHYKFLNQNPIVIFEGSENIYRDFIHVDEVIDRLIELTNKEGVYNIGSKKTQSFKEVAEYCSQITGANIITEPFPDHLKENYQYFTQAK